MELGIISIIYLSACLIVTGIMFSLVYENFKYLYIEGWKNKFPISPVDNEAGGSVMLCVMMWLLFSLKAGMKWGYITLGIFIVFIILGMIIDNLIIHIRRFSYNKKNLVEGTIIIADVINTEFNSNTKYPVIISDEKIKEGWEGRAYKKDVKGKVFKHFFTLNTWYDDAKIVLLEGNAIPKHILKAIFIDGTLRNGDKVLVERDGDNKLFSYYDENSIFIKKS